jgi:hypothetical protein
MLALTLPDLDVARVQRWCAARVPEHARHEVRLECQVGPRHLTIVERRAPWREELGREWTSSPIARLRYTTADMSWTLYWRDRNPSFPRLRPTGSIVKSRRPPRRDQPRPHRDLLGLTSPEPWLFPVPGGSDQTQLGRESRPTGARSAQALSRMPWLGTRTRHATSKKRPVGVTECDSPVDQSLRRRINAARWASPGSDPTSRS